MENDIGNHKKWTLLDLPVYTLRILLSFLDATTLYQLSQTCTYLRDCIEDPAFWKYIDARSIPNTELKLVYCTDKIYEKTSHIFFSSKLGHGRIPIYFFHKIKPFTNLKILSLEYQKLSGYGITLKNFPSSLEELSLKGTKLNMRDSVSFFQHSSTNMGELRVLILDNCTWLTCSFLISVAKYKNLEIISVVNCPRIHLHTVPYLNVAKYGLKKLKVFDCRFTGIGAELLHTFYSKESIQKFYFQSFNCAQVDYKMNFPANSKLQLPSESYVDLQISDFSLSHYHGITILSSNSEKICESILYEDPYPDCTCGHKEYHEDEPDCQISEEDIPISPVTRFICDKHSMNMRNLPDTFRDFCVSSQREPAQVLKLPDEDESSDDDDFACCTIGTTSKMVILQNINDPSRRQEIVIPGNSSRFSGRQMNIFIVNPLGERENPLADLENENPLMNLENIANENRHNENQENVNRDGANENMENENRQNSAENVDTENSRENVKSENRDKSQNVETKSNENESNENENNENKISENSQLQFMESINLPGTSRGILENCMNENTENSRIEVERLQNESENKNEDLDETSNQNSDCDNRGNNDNSQKEDCNSSVSVNEEIKKLNKHIIVKRNNSKDILVIERSLFSTSSPSNSSDAPSCSGVSTNKTSNDIPSSSAEDQSNVQDDSRRQSRKRRNDDDKDRSSSEDELNRSKKRQCKVLVRDEKPGTPTTSSCTENVGPLIQNVLRDNDNDQPSTSGCSRKTTAERQAPNDDVDNSSRPEPRNERDRPNLGSVLLNAYCWEQPRGEVGPEIRRDVVDFCRSRNNAENARRINIRHLFPRLRYRFPANEHKVSLRCLSLRGYKRITDTTLQYIKHLNLELLDLTYTSVTKEGIESFLLENTNCRIIHQNYCRCKPKNPF